MRTNVVNINENHFNSKQEFIQLYIQKLRTAKVIGFEGVKILNRQLNTMRRKIMGDLFTQIKLEEYFPEQLDQRIKDQGDLLLELCKADF